VLIPGLLLALQDPTTSADRLRSESIEEREEAIREHLKLGKTALPLLQPLESDPDFEVAARGSSIVRELTGVDSRRPRLRIEETLSRAKSLHLRFSSRGPGMEIPTPGELWVKGDKFRGRIGSAPGPATLQITSDGQRMRVERCTTAPEEFAIPEGQGRDLLIGVVRLGARSSVTGKCARTNLEGVRVRARFNPRPESCAGTRELAAGTP